MDVERFKQELAELVNRHGAQLVEPVEISNVSTLYHEYYTHPVPEMRGLHMFGAVREIQPVQLKISIEMDRASDWKHSVNYTPMSSDLFLEKQETLF